MAKRFYTCIIVPDASKQLHKLRIPVPAVYVVAAVAAISFLGAVALGFHYIGMATRTADLQKLEAENARLKVDNNQLRLSTTKLNKQVTALEFEAENIARILDADPLLRRISRSKGSIGGSTVNILTSSLVNIDDLRARLEDLERQLSMLDETTKKFRATPTIWPIEGNIGSHYGARLDPFTGDAETHLGIDIIASSGTPIKAPADGVVLFADRQGEYGNLIVLEHPDGLTTRFGHLSRFNVRPNATVQKGQVIGWVGATGRTTAPHLHYEVRLNDRPVNPRPYLR